MAKVSTDRIEDQETLPQVALRDPHAMKECVDRYGGLVWRIARRYVRPDSDAEDVVQEVFTEVWEKAGRYDARQSSEATFIGLVARRRSIDWLRKKSRQPQLEAIPEDLPEPTAMNSARVDRESVQLALKKLSGKTQELFRLHFEMGLSHPEIASKTGLPLGTVKTQLRRGLIEMRSVMRQIGVESHSAS